MENIFKKDHTLSRELAVNALQNIDIGIMILDVTGNVIFVNKTFEELLGYAADEIIGLDHKTVVSRLLGRSHDSIKADFDESVKRNQIFQKCKFIHKNGQVMLLEFKATFIAADNYFVPMMMLRDLHEDLMVEVTNLVNSTLSLEQVLNNTVTAVVDYLGLASTAVFLLNEEKTELQLICCNAFLTKEDLAKVKMKVGEGPPGMIVQEGKPVYVRNLRTEVTLHQNARKFHSDKSSVGFPLICKDEILGVIAFDAHTVRDFTDKEMVLFQHITNQVALAIYNARMFSRLEHLSWTDGLTGLYNHRYFHQFLSSEISGSSEEKKSFGVLMIDADNFKSFNDRFGHLRGDQLLKELAQVIMKNVRSIDIVARYGGEEFSVLLLKCSREDAFIIAQRIRKEVEEFEFCSNTEAASRMTISVGMAMYMDDTHNLNLLLEADKALYRAKQLGRNRVEVFDGN